MYAEKEPIPTTLVQKRMKDVSKLTYFKLFLANRALLRKKNNNKKNKKLQILEGGFKCILFRAKRGIHDFFLEEAILKLLDNKCIVQLE